MKVFCDTSAIYALMAAEDRMHETARAVLTTLDTAGASLHSALLQARMGLSAVRTFQENVFPVLEMQWVNGRVYEKAMAALLAAGKTGVSLTDWTSFEIMREQGIQRAFAFDEHFTEQGFELASVR